MNKLYPIASSNYSGTINGYKTNTSVRDAVGSIVSYVDKNMLHISTDAGITFTKVKLQFIPTTVAIFTKSGVTKILVCSVSSGIVYNTNCTVDRVLYTGQSTKSVSVTAQYLVVFTSAAALVYNLSTDYTLSTCTFAEQSLFGFVAPDDDYLKIGSFISNSEIKFYEITGVVINSHNYSGMTNVVEISQFSNEDILVECTYNGAPGLYKVDTTSFAVELLFAGTEIEFATRSKVFTGTADPDPGEGDTNGPLFVEFSFGNFNYNSGGV